MTDRIWVGRHGRTGSNASGRYLGALDDDLDDVGLEQARRLASWVSEARIDAIVTSPARRARRTASIIGAVVDIEPSVDHRLRELDFGVGEGRTLDELRLEDPRAVARFELDPVTHHLPGGEDPREAVSRMRAAVDDILKLNATRPLVVTHNTALRLLVCDILRVPLQEYRRLLPVAEHCAITELSVTDGRLALRRFNAPPPCSHSVERP